MPDIDPSRIRPGDTVRARFHDEAMKAAGVDPMEFEGVVYNDDLWGPCIGPLVLDAGSSTTLLEHVPARPDWADALVGRFGECLYGRSGKTWTEIGGHGRKYEESEFHRLIAAAANDPITVVLDADGNPPTPELIDEAKRLRAIRDAACELARELEGGWPTVTLNPEPANTWRPKPQQVFRRST